MIALSRKRPATFIIPDGREKHQVAQEENAISGRLLGGRGVLGDGLGALRDGVLGELTRQDQSHGGLDLAR